MNDTLIFVLSAGLVILIGAVVRGKTPTKTNATIMLRGKSTGIFIAMALAGVFGVALSIEQLKSSPALQTASSTASPVSDPQLENTSFSSEARSGAPASHSMVSTAVQQKTVPIEISGPARFYESNASTANEYHEGGLLQVSGTVQNIDRDIFNNIIVTLHSGNQFSSGHASLDGRYKNAAASLKTGQKITLLCESGAVVVGSLILRHCVPA